MRSAAAYAETLTMTLSQERAFEELYLRLARRTGEAMAGSVDDDWPAINVLLERCVALLGYMSGLIDVSRSYETAAAILSLNRFAIGALIRAKSERDQKHLEGLPQLFVSLAEIFAVMDLQAIAPSTTIRAGQ